MAYIFPGVGTAIEAQCCRSEDCPVVPELRGFVDEHRDGSAWTACFPHDSFGLGDHGVRLQHLAEKAAEPRHIRVTISRRGIFRPLSSSVHVKKEPCPVNLN